MDIKKYCSAAQVAELEALAKSLEEMRKIKLPVSVLTYLHRLSTRLCLHASGSYSGLHATQTV
jgi:hypothetical protein